MNYESRIMNYGVFDFIKTFIPDTLFVIQIYKVSGNSMLPALKAGDYVIAEKLSYNLRNPKVNEVVVAKSPEGGRKIIKRIVAKFGDQYKIEGDNKSESTDSRDFGLINKGDIVGRVFLWYSVLINIKNKSNN